MLELKRKVPSTLCVKQHQHGLLCKNMGTGVSVLDESELAVFGNLIGESEFSSVELYEHIIPYRPHIDGIVLLDGKYVVHVLGV